MLRCLRPMIHSPHSRLRPLIYDNREDAREDTRGGGAITGTALARVFAIVFGDCTPKSSELARNAGSRNSRELYRA